MVTDATKELEDALRMALPLIKAASAKGGECLASQAYERACNALVSSMFERLKREPQVVEIRRYPKLKGRSPEYRAIALPPNIHVEIRDYQTASERPSGWPLLEDFAGDKYYLITKTWQE